MKNERILRAKFEKVKSNQADKEKTHLNTFSFSFCQSHKHVSSISMQCSPGAIIGRINKVKTCSFSLDPDLWQTDFWRQLDSQHCGTSGQASPADRHFSMRVVWVNVSQSTCRDIQRSPPVLVFHLDGGRWYLYQIGHACLLDSWAVRSNIGYLEPSTIAKTVVLFKGPYRCCLP